MIEGRERIEAICEQAQLLLNRHEQRIARSQELLNRTYERLTALAHSLQATWIVLLNAALRKGRTSKPENFAPDPH